MTSSIEETLRNNYVDGAWHTHVSLVQPKGRFNFNRKGIEKLWDIYCDNIQKEDCIVGLAEKPQQYLPILVDVDLKIKDDGTIDYGEHLYTEEQCTQVIEIYQSVLREIIDKCDDDNLLCVVLEKPIYWVNAGEYSYAKNGFHLHFPGVFLNKADQEVHLLPRVRDLVKKMNIFSNLGIEDSSIVIDKAACKNHWLVYGSRKSEDMDPYTVTKVISSDGIEMDIEEAFSDYKIYDINEKSLDIKGRIKEYLPRILSIVPWGRQVHEVKNGLSLPIKEKIKDSNKKEYKPLSLTLSDSLKLAEKLLDLVADWRAEDYHEWMQMGWVLYNIGDGGEEAMQLWLNFSSRCGEKYDEASCVYEWEKMIKKNYTIGTLRHIAKKDNPKAYADLVKEKIQNKIKDSLDGSHNDIAKVLEEEYGNDFVCASITNKCWFRFNGQIWEEMEEGNYLREKISDEKGLVEKFKDQLRECITHLGGDDKAEKAMYEARMKQITKVINNLKSAPFKNNVMKEAMEVFYNREFKQKLDQNKNLIAFKNGVYDLNENKFRDGLPEDYISKCLPIDYREYQETDEEVENVVEFLQKVFPDSSIRTYFLDTYSDIFVGGNTQKKVYLWTGEGDNGKSITQAFFDRMLGELAIKFNTQYFTGKKVSTGSANPELARAAPPVRHVTMEEPDADETLNIGELKKLSGGDTYWARDLFEKGKSSREVKPMFTLTFICNKLPKLKYSDKATWNRLRVIPFESTFVEPGQPCPKTFEEQLLEKKFPMDKQFDSKINGMIGAFAWYLLEWRKKVTIRIEPEKVKEATAIYRRQNDIYRQFIEENITEDPNAVISLAEMYAHFKEWFKEGWSNMTVPIKNEVKEYFEKLWGDTEKGYRWTGYRIRSLQEELDSGDAVILEEDDLVNYDDNGGKALPPM